LVGEAGGKELAKQKAEGHGPWDARLMPAVREELLRQIRAASGSLADLAQIVAKRAMRADLIQQKLGMAEHTGQQTVELVSDFSGQPANRIHPVGLAQASLEHVTLSNVAQIDHDAVDAREIKEVGGNRLHVPPRAVGVTQPHPNRCAPAARQVGSVQELGQALGVLGMG